MSKSEGELESKILWYIDNYPRRPKAMKLLIYDKLTEAKKEFLLIQGPILTEETMIKTMEWFEKWFGR